MGIAEKYPVIVAGGGPSGIMAALASAKNGAKTLLVEKAAFLGGTATICKIGPIAPFHFGDEQVVNGLPQAFIEELVKHGGATGHMKCLNPYGTGVYVCVYSHEIYKYVAQKILTEAGVDILFYSEIREVLKKENKVCGVKIGSRFGGYTVAADVVIDATGDGDVAALAGEGYEYGDGLGGTQPSSAMFEMANVDMERLYRYVLDNLQDFGRLSDMVPFVDSPFRDNPYFVVQGYQSLVDKAVASGELKFGRENVHTTTGLYPGIMHFNTARISNYDTLSLKGRSDSEIDGRNQIESIAEFMVKRVPGYEHAYISSTENEVGVRESRHIHGVYTLQAEDIFNQRKFPDVIARGLFAIDIHGGKQASAVKGAGGLWREIPDAYDIPYSICVPKTVDGLLLAGRCVSADHIPFSSIRTQGSLMAYSQAVGAAAALCVRHGVEPRALDVRELQSVLVEMGASPWRDEEKKRRQEERAAQVVREYLKRHDTLITPEKYLAPYRD